MFKVIFKTAFKTLFLVAILALVAFGVASLGFPSEMAELCEKSGNYSMAAGYASLSYTYTGDIKDLNRCFVDNIYSKNDNDVVKFGDKLISDEKFSEFCESTTGIEVVIDGEKILIPVDYRQYVCGNVAAAKFRNGKKDEAFDTATAAMDGADCFRKNNALAILSLQVIESGDNDMAARLLAEVEKFAPAEGEEDYYNALINELRNVGGEEQ